MKEEETIMLNELTTSIFNNTIASSISALQIAGAIGTSLMLGLIIALTYMHNTRYTKSFVITLALLPAIIGMVIIMVNGSVGTGVAVAGAFSLVRFRSVPGTASEICAIFLAMAAGLITGMGYLGLAAAFTVILCLTYLVYGKVDFGARRNADRYKTFKVVIPEDLDYTDIFEDIFEEYTASCELTGVKTVNMGSMFKLTYDTVLKDPSREKEMIDRMRCRNGNLEITVSRQGTVPVEL